ncbi:hypothetical protein LCGC14_2909160, partial [marine sediment metagenome]
MARDAVPLNANGAQTFGPGPDNPPPQPIGFGGRLWPHTECGGAVLTGSQVYGTPTDASDVDLVVLCDEETQVRLAKLLTGEEPATPSSGPRGGISVKAGNLNLILTSRPEEVELWRT